MANIGHMDDDHPHGRNKADLFGGPGGTLRLRDTDDTPHGREADESSDAEARMRQALGLFGTRPGAGGDSGRHHEPHGGSDRRTPGGGSGSGARRHRFVQDGEVPVSVVRGRPGQVARPAGPENDRHAEELAAERQLRAEAERRLGECQIQLRSLQTRIGHAELERDNALAEARTWRERAEEALARVEQASAAEPAAAEIEMRHESSVDPDTVADEADPAHDSTQAARAARRGRRRPDEPQLDLIEPEPVKWWV